MNKIVVSDTNIFIDLIDIGLIDALFHCGLEVHTTAMVIDEIKDDAQRDVLLSFSELVTRKYKEQDYRLVFEYYTTAMHYSNLSVTDCSVLLYARELGCPLITNDGKLRNTAKDEGVEVKRLLSVIMYMVEMKAISKDRAATAMKKLMETNSRAPMELIEEFIKKLKEEEDMR